MFVDILTPIFHSVFHVKLIVLIPTPFDLVLISLIFIQGGEKIISKKNKQIWAKSELK